CASVEAVVAEPAELRAELYGLFAANPGNSVCVLKIGIAASLREAVFSAEFQRVARHVDLGKYDRGRSNPEGRGIVFIVLNKVDAHAIQPRAEFIRQRGREDVCFS